MNVNDYTNFLVAVLSIVIIYSLVKRNRFFLNIFKIERYDNKEYIKWLKNNKLVSYPKNMVTPLILIIIINSIFLYTYIQIKENVVTTISIFITIILLLVSIKYQMRINKRISSFSKRLKRLMIFSFLVSIIEIIIMILLYILIFGYNIYYYPILLLGIIIIYLELPYNILLANYLVKPVEVRLYKKEYNDACDKIAFIKGLKTIGITGNFGKGENKMIISKILEKRYNVLKLEEHSNSTKDIARVINEKLNYNHEIFIADMSDRGIKDIEEISNLTKPLIGILTDIEPTNVQLINNMKNTMKTQYKLIEALPAEGIAIFNYDNKFIKKLADKTFKEKILYGIDSPEELDLYATNIEMNKDGTVFILHYKEESIKCRTKLLGKENILNILSAASISIVLGLSLDDISNGIKSIEIFPKKLQLINKENGVIQIDDRYITGPIETNKSLEVINEFKGRKIIITTGFFQLDKENRSFGKNISKIFDKVILVGIKQTKEVYEGLMDGAFYKENIIIVNSLEEAWNKVSNIEKSGDIVLWENEI